MDSRQIEYQFSTSVALAQETEKLDTYAANLLSALGSYKPPGPIAATGLRLSRSSPDLQVLAKAHGKSVYSTYDNIWHNDGQRFPQLVGRIQFWLSNRKAEDEIVICEVLFDLNGNMKTGTDKYFSKTLSEQEYPSILRSIALNLINGIHQALDTITTDY